MNNPSYDKQIAESDNGETRGDSSDVLNLVELSSALLHFVLSWVRYCESLGYCKLAALYLPLWYYMSADAELEEE